MDHSEEVGTDGEGGSERDAGGAVKVQTFALRVKTQDVLTQFTQAVNAHKGIVRRAVDESRNAREFLANWCKN